MEPRSNSASQAFVAAFAAFSGATAAFAFGSYSLGVLYSAATCYALYEFHRRERLPSQAALLTKADLHSAQLERSRSELEQLRKAVEGLTSTQAALNQLRSNGAAQAFRRGG
jgi:hypothetical protein